jgi:hypothetical protein
MNQRKLPARLAPGILMVALAALAACASPDLPAAPSAERATAAGSGAEPLPARAEVAGVPFHAQTENHCGPASLATVLGWSGLPAQPEDVAGLVLTPGRDGALGHDLVAAARRADRLAVPVAGVEPLLAELAAGHPVLVLQNLGLDWYPQWHFAVAVGYDLEAGTLTLRSGEEERQVMALATFARTWERADQWGLVVLPPDRLPASAGEEAVLQAAFGLEQAGSHQAAVAAYGAALDRWPGSLAALIGLGNARYGAGQLLGAEAAFRTAVSFHPEEAAAWNNLAHVLAEQGELAEALAAAKRAVDLGGANEAYQATLEEIEAI